MPLVDRDTPRRAPSVTMTDIVFPTDANPYGTMFGGKVMAMMDKAAFLASARFARAAFVTISADDIQFKAPLVQGDIIEVAARVAYAGRTSVIVKVEAWMEHPFTGDRRLCSSSWFAMAARDGAGQPERVPPLALETDEERAEAAEAEAFRKRSLERRTAK